MQNVLSILFCLSLFYLAVTLRIKAYINILRMQGILLTVILIFPFINNFSAHALIIPLLILFVKAILIPNLINKVILDNDIKRIVKPTIQQFNFLLISILAMILTFVAASVLSKSSNIETIPFASGFSAIVVGILLIIFREKLIVHVVGFLVLENGIFLFSASVASEFPMIIEIGVLLDVFVVVFLMGTAIKKISANTSDSDVNALWRLKD